MSARTTQQRERAQRIADAITYADITARCIWGFITCCAALAVMTLIDKTLIESWWAIVPLIGGAAFAGAILLAQAMPHIKARQRERISAQRFTADNGNYVDP